jgi:hypothetical protein
MAMNGRRIEIDLDDELRNGTAELTLKHISNYRAMKPEEKIVISLTFSGRPISCLKRIIDYLYGMGYLHKGDKTAVLIAEYCIDKGYWSPFEITMAPIAKGIYGNLKEEGNENK